LTAVTTRDRDEPVLGDRETPVLLAIQRERDRVEGADGGIVSVQRRRRDVELRRSEVDEPGPGGALGVGCGVDATYVPGLPKTVRASTAM
jgi:hypothetical protein